MTRERTASDAFRLLSDEIRLDILRAVAVAQYEGRKRGIAALSFTEIYERVDVENSSKLSYHLGELSGTFLRKRGDDYAFTHAGEQLVRFILAENFEDPPDVEPVETEGVCLHCGESSLSAQIEDQYFLIRCTACERPAYSYKVRPAQVRNRSGTEQIQAVIWDQVGDFLKMRQGVCPDCGGRMETTVLDAEEQPVNETLPVSYGILSECESCLRHLGFPLPYIAAYHPESVTFHWEHGTDILGTGVWKFHQHLDEGRWRSNQVDTDPAEYRVELQRETTTLRLYLDACATVTRTERVQRRDQRDRSQ